MLEWVVCRTKPNQEKRASANLTRCEYVFYCPTFFDSRLKRAVFLFPSYVFVQVEDRRISALRSLYGLAGVVKRGKAPDICPDHVVEQLRARENAQGFVVLDPFEPPVLATGAPVRLSGGLFGGQSGLYEGMRSQERVSVLLDLLGQPRRVFVEADHIEAL